MNNVTSSSNIAAVVKPWMLFLFFALSHSTETLCAASLPSITEYFGSSSSLTKKTTSAYFLGFSLGIIVFGRFSDLFGRRPIALMGWGLYFISAVILCFFCDNLYALIFLRFLQGFGASVGSVVSQAMARDCYFGEDLSKLFTMISLGMSMIPSLGSMAGAHITESLGWRYIFALQAVLSICVLVVAWMALPETNTNFIAARKVSFGKVLLSVSTSVETLLYALIIGSFNGFLFAFFVVAPFIFKYKLCLTPSEYGYITISISVSYFLSSAFGRIMMYYKVNNWTVMFIGMVLNFMGCCIFLLNGIFRVDELVGDKEFAVVMMLLPIVAHGLGHNLVTPSALRFSLERYAHISGSAGAVFGAMYYGVIAIISASVAELSSDNTLLPVGIMFAILSSVCAISMIAIHRMYKKRAQETLY